MPLISINFRPLTLVLCGFGITIDRYKSDSAPAIPEGHNELAVLDFSWSNRGITVEFSAEVAKSRCFESSPAEGCKCLFLLSRSQEPFHKSTLSELGQHQDFSTPEPGGRKVEQQWAESQGFRVGGLGSLVWKTADLKDDPFCCE